MERIGGNVMNHILPKIRLIGYVFVTESVSLSSAKSTEFVDIMLK